MVTPLRRQIAAAGAELVTRTKGLESTANGVDWYTGGDATALDALEWAAALRDELTEYEDLIVRQARVEGASWSAVAEPFGMTKQGAQQRWTPVAPPAELPNVRTK